MTPKAFNASAPLPARALQCAVLALALGLFLVACSPLAQEGSEASADVQSASSASGQTPTEADAASDAATNPAAPAGVDARTLQAAVAPVATDTDMDVSITCIDLASGASASIAGLNQQPASSMIKLAVAAAFFECEAAGQISRDEEHTIADYEVVGGSGVYKDMVGQTITMGDAVNKMISNSDNVATNIIIDRLGIYTINSSIQKLGFAGTQLTSRMLDPDSSRWSADNTMTSDDAASLLQQAYEGSLVSAEASATLMEALRAQQDADGISAGLPDSTVFAHKTAASWNCRHDGGVVEGAHPYVLVVMCSQQDEEIDDAAALDLLGRAGTAANSAIAG